MDEMYVGYRDHAPPGIARFVRRVVALLLAAAAGLAVLLAAIQGPFDPGTFEFGVTRSFAGTVALEPAPRLLVERPGKVTPTAPATSGLLLVAPGKHGAGPEVAEHEGRRVRLEGSLIYRDATAMLEIDPASVTADDGTAPPPGGVLDLGVHTLAGEIVDSKCFLGVMKPGRGKAHRACAALCIRGGIPPALAVRTEDGAWTLLLLVDPRGVTLGAEIAGLVGRPVEATGRVRREGDLLVMTVAGHGLRPLARIAHEGS